MEMRFPFMVVPDQIIASKTVRMKNHERPVMAVAQMKPEKVSSSVVVIVYSTTTAFDPAA